MVYVHFAEGFEEIEAVTVVDVLRRGGIETEMVSIMEGRSVGGSHGIHVEADLLFEEADYENCEMIVLPGGANGTANLAAHEGLASVVKGFAENGKYLAAICAAPMVLGKLGILDGREATIYPGMEEHLAGARASADSVVVDGNIITSRGAGTALEFALALVGILKGAQEKARLAESMVAPAALRA
ncbi:MAG: DJ-1/PfpI family protein [Clostridiales bacterium]|nr:DJ-1/PfpI family protein [Clostridiales bacterium]